MNNQRPLAKSKQTSNNHQFHAFFPSSMNNNKENLFKDIFYMDPLLIENLTQEELRTHLILSE